VVTARRDSVLVGIAPMFVRRHRGLLVCRLLGGHESALGDLLVGEDRDGTTASSLMRHLASVPFHYLDAFGMPGDGALPRLAKECRLTVLRRVEAPVLLMPDGWDAAYNARTPSKKRNLHRRRLRQLAEVGAVSWTTARTPDEVAAELEHAFEIHARRWQGRPDGSTFGMDAGRAFHREGARALAEHDEVRILTLRIDGRPVAFHYSFVLGTTMYVHRLAFDPELARLSPGQVTLLHHLADASSEGVTRVEFLGGDERYKVELADGLEPMHQAIGMARGPVARVAVRSLLWMITTRMRLKRNARLHHLYQEGLGPVRRLVRRRAD
jgi:CelD/BcsL family acetyltransferase involved in cellulose biosynthesis